MSGSSSEIQRDSSVAILNKEEKESLEDWRDFFDWDEILEEMFCENPERAAELKEAIEALSLREQFVLFFTLGSEKEDAVWRLAKGLDVSPETISRIQEEAIEKLSDAVLEI